MKPYPQSPTRPVPAGIVRPPYVGRMEPEDYEGSDIQSDEVVERMRVAGRIAADAILVAAARIAPGVTTDELDAVAHEFMCDHHAWPASLDYRGFPKSICTSVNEVICHGIPDKRPLEDGDIIKLDVTAYAEGVHGDNCATFYVGEVDEQSRKLSEVTRASMYRAIKACKPGRSVSVIGRVIERYARRFAYDVVREYTGHGIGTAMHQPPDVPNYGRPGKGPRIVAGMCLCVEPMATLGGEDVAELDDGWTVVTCDSSRAAHWENTVAITEHGLWVLTEPDGGEAELTARGVAFGPLNE